MLTIGGRQVDTRAPAPELDTLKLGKPQVVIARNRVAILVNGQEALYGPRTIDNIELIADILSEYGYWREADEMRRAKYLR